MTDVEIGRRLARARSRRVMFATPVYRDTAAKYAMTMFRLSGHMMQSGISCEYRQAIGNSNLPRARNELVAEFMASACTDLLFIDADMGAQPESVVRMLAADHDLVGAVGRKKTEETPTSAMNAWCFRLLPGRDLRSDEMGNIEVESVGTGFLRISRKVFEGLKAARPDRKRKPLRHMTPEQGAEYYGYFRFGDDQFDTGEDYGLCHDWRAIGGEVWIDPFVRLSHNGDKNFSGCVADDFFEGAATAAAEAAE